MSAWYVCWSVVCSWDKEKEGKMKETLFSPEQKLIHLPVLFHYFLLFFFFFFPDHLSFLVLTLILTANILFSHLPGSTCLFCGCICETSKERKNPQTSFSHASQTCTGPDPFTGLVISLSGKVEEEEEKIVKQEIPSSLLLIEAGHKKKRRRPWKSLILFWQVYSACLSMPSWQRRSVVKKENDFSSCVWEKDETESFSCSLPSSIFSKVTGENTHRNRVQRFKTRYNILNSILNVLQ